jgi:carnitine O-acetyltransferase
MGELDRMTLTLTTDYMQFTITSRTEMPNEEFVDEISRAAVDLHGLYFGGEVPASRL